MKVAAQVGHLYRDSFSSPWHPLICLFRVPSSFIIQDLHRVQRARCLLSHSLAGHVILCSIFAKFQVGASSSTVSIVGTMIKRRISYRESPMRGSNPQPSDRRSLKSLTLYRLS